MKKGVAAAPRHALLGTSTAIMGGPAALATDYSNSDGRRLPNPALARAVVPSRGISLEKRKRQNKGLHRTAHKLPNLRGIAMITPVEAAHYCACALSVSPDVLQ